MRSAPAVLALLGLLATKVPAQAQLDPHQHHQRMDPAPAMDHSAHNHDVGPAGSTYDLRWIDGMVQHHTGALRMSEFVFDIGVPGVGRWPRRSGAIRPRRSRQWASGAKPGTPRQPSTRWR